MSRPNPQSPSDDLLILVVDDDLDARGLYARYLRTLGCEVSTASDGRSAIDQAIQFKPDLIVLDLAMPRVDGWTVLKSLRESSWTAQVFIVVVTALIDTRDEAFQAGCDAHLVKPCPPDVLWLQIRALLRSRPETHAKLEQRLGEHR